METFRLALVVAAVTAGLGVLAAPAGADTGDEIVVARVPDLSGAERADLRADADVTLVAPVSPTVELVRADTGERAGALAALRADPDVRWAEPNHERRALAVPSFAWDVRQIAAPTAWQRTQGTGATVAVVDTGVSSGHPDLLGRVAGGWNFVAPGSAPEDDHGHGTHVSGTIAADDDDSLAVGVAPASQIMPLKVLDSGGHGTSAEVATAFEYAGSRGVRVVNASLGADQPSRAELEAITRWPNTLFVAAAGNEGRNVESQPSYPCSYTAANVVCVGASDRSDRPASFGTSGGTNVGAASVDLFAPGVEIVSDVLGGALQAWNGTSMAAPHVAAAAALLVAARPGLSAADAKAALLTSATRVPALSGLSVTGARLDAAKALEIAGAADTRAPAAPAGLTATAVRGGAQLDWADSADGDLASYRIQRLVGATWQVAATATASAATVGSLPAGMSSLRVTAVDRAGNESAPSAVVTVTPLSAAAAVVQTLALRPNRVVVCRHSHGCRARSARLAFRTARATTLTMTVERRTCARGRCAWRRSGTRRAAVSAGAHAWPVGARLRGVRLQSGRQRVTLGRGKGGRRTTFTVAVR